MNRRCARLTAARAATWLGILVVPVAACVDPTPDSPPNAVMDFLTSAQTGGGIETNDLLCERLRSGSSPDEMATVGRIVEEASVFGDGLVDRDGDAATVRVLVLFAPSGPGAVGDPWHVSMVHEGGRWKVCGFEPVG